MVVFYHRGGWVYGSNDEAEGLCRKIANRTHHIVVQAEYRLSPEHKFPVPLEDCYDAVNWVSNHLRQADDAELDIVVMGESAGGNLAAAVSLMAENNQRPKISAQILIYPVLTSEMNEEHYEKSPDKHLLSYRNMKWFWEQYLPHHDHGNSALASPLKAERVSSLPRTMVVTAEFDALRHEGEAFARKLKDARIDVVHKQYPSVIHGFLDIPVPSPEIENALDDISSFLEFGALSTPPAISVFSNSQEVGNAAAQKIVDVIINKQRGGNSRIVIGFATGNTPIPAYLAFKKLVRENGLDLSNVVTFNLDEYMGVPTSHPQSYHSFMFAYLFNDLVASPTNPKGIKIENIHIPKGATKSKEDLSQKELDALSEKFPHRKQEMSLTLEEQFWIAEQRAKDYERLIQALGPIDLQILGIGRNGHIGFAEPGTPFDSPTMVAKLTENTRSINASFFDGNVHEVPEFAITMGIKTILNATEILLLATGTSKAAIIHEVLKSPISPDIPCTALRLHKKTSFFLDKEAALIFTE